MEQEQNNNQDNKLEPNLELKDKKSRKKPIIIGLIVLLLAALISFGVVSYFKKQSDNDKKQGNSKEIKHLTIATLDGPMNAFFLMTMKYIQVHIIL